jgi:hypothetical protein
MSRGRSQNRTRNPGGWRTWRHDVRNRRKDEEHRSSAELRRQTETISYTLPFVAVAVAQLHLDREGSLVVVHRGTRLPKEDCRRRHAKADERVCSLRYGSWQRVVNRATATEASERCVSRRPTPLVDARRPSPCRRTPSPSPPALSLRRRSPIHRSPSSLGHTRANAGALRGQTSGSQTAAGHTCCTGGQRSLEPRGVFAEVPGVRGARGHRFEQEEL